MILKQRVSFCFFLCFDIIVALATIAPPLSKESEDSAMDINQTTVGHKTKADGGLKEWMSKEAVFVKVFLLLLLLFNFTFCSVQTSIICEAIDDRNNPLQIFTDFCDKKHSAGSNNVEVLIILL